MTDFSTQLTVGITYYNEKELLTRCLESLCQSDPLPERIVVIDDGATFPAKDYIPSAFSFVELIRTEQNEGLSKSRNYLLTRCLSEFIHFHDADDFFLPGWTDATKKALSKNQVDVLICGLRSINDKGKVTEDVMELFKIGSKLDILAFCLLESLLPSALTYRTEKLRGIGGFPTFLSQAEDFYVNARLAIDGASFEKLDQTLAVRWERYGSMSKDRIAGGKEALLAMQKLKPLVPKSHLPYLADRAAKLGSSFFQLGAKTEAREAFRIAKELGNAPFAHRPRLVRLVAKTFGPELAESMANQVRAIKKSSRR